MLCDDTAASPRLRFLHPCFHDNARAPALSLKGKYIVLDSGNELVNRLRGVLSGFLLGVVSDRVFVADITYQKDTNVGLLSALFEGPGYQVKRHHRVSDPRRGACVVVC